MLASPTISNACLSIVKLAYQHRRLPPPQFPADNLPKMEEGSDQALLVLDLDNTCVASTALAQRSIQFV